MIVNPYLVTPGVSYDPDAQAFITATAISGSNANAINELVLDLKAANIWTKFNALYPIIGGTAASHKFNLINPLDTDAAFRLSFSTGWTHSGTGMTPNGSAYADTFFNTNAYRNNNHLTYYIRTNIDQASVDAGVFVNIGGGEYFDIESRISNISYYGNHTTATAISYANTDSRGFHINTRTTSNLFKVYLNSTLKGTNTNPTSTAINLNMYLGCRNTSGSPAAYSTKQCAFASLGTGLTDTESQLFYQIVEKYQVALSRNINPTQSFYYNRNYNNETNAFLFATQITDTTQQTAVNTLVNDFKSAGIWTKMKSVYPIVGGTAATHAVNLSAPGTYNLTFSTGWTHATTGMTGNGSSSYADTSLIPNSVLSLNSTHISAYTRSNILIDAPLLSSDNATTYANGLYIWAKQTGAPNNSSVRLNDNTSDGVAAPADIRGLHLATRTASNVKKYRLNNTQQFSVTSSSTGLNTSSIYIGASRNNPNYNSSQIAFSSIGDGLTDLEAQLFYQIVEKYQVALSRNTNPTQSFYYNTSYNPETNAFLFNTGITDATTISATDTLVTTLKTQGIWTKMKAVYPIVGGTAATHKFNLVNPVDTNAAFRLTFSTGWIHSSTGMTPNGTSAYAETFFNPVTQLTNYKAHIGLYIGTNTATGIDYGVSIAGYGNEFWMGSRYGANGIHLAMYDMDNSFNIGWIKSPTTDSRGFTLGTAQSNVSLKVFKNGTQVATKTTTNTTTPVNDTAVIGAAKISPSTYVEYTDKQFRFVSSGDDLTDAQAANFYTAVQAFQTTLGRQV